MAVDSEADALPQGTPETLAWTGPQAQMARELAARLQLASVRDGTAMGALENGGEQLGENVGDAGGKGGAAAYIGYDWDASLRSLGTDDAVGGLWASLASAVRGTDMTVGSLQLGTQRKETTGAGDEAGSRDSVGESEGFRAASQQRGILRLSCVDGLRTSMACETFTIMLVAMEMFKRFLFHYLCLNISD